MATWKEQRTLLEAMVAGWASPSEGRAIRAALARLDAAETVVRAESVRGEIDSPEGHLAWSDYLALCCEQDSGESK